MVGFVNHGAIGIRIYRIVISAYGVRLAVIGVVKMGYTALYPGSQSVRAGAKCNGGANWRARLSVVSAPPS